MTNPQKENSTETSETSYSKDLANSANPLTDAEHVEPAETSKPILYPKPTHSIPYTHPFHTLNPPIPYPKPTRSLP